MKKKMFGIFQNSSTRQIKVSHFIAVKPYFQKQSSELSQGVGNNAKQFQHFKAQIEKLTTNMTTLEKETSQWREKSEVCKILIIFMTLCIISPLYKIIFS